MDFDSNYCLDYHVHLYHSTEIGHELGTEGKLNVVRNSQVSEGGNVISGKPRDNQQIHKSLDTSC